MSIKIERNRKMWYIGENAYDIAVKVNEVFYKMPWNIGTSQIEECGKEDRHKQTNAVWFHLCNVQ